MRSVLAAALALGALAAPLAAASTLQEAERLRTAKALFFDREYEQARQVWLALRSSSDREEASAARYWVARCSDSLGEHERALSEYGEYLAGRPLDPLLVEEAKTSRIGLASRLHREGVTRHLSILRRGLEDDSRTVRYYAALQLAGLGTDVGRPAIPVLKEILAEESDADLVDRARLRLLRLDPAALERSPSPGGRAPEVRWVRLEIREAGASKPEVSLSFPVALAELVFKSLPEDARQELSRNGIDAGNFWERLKSSGPTSIVEIHGDDGEHIRLWLE